MNSKKDEPGKGAGPAGASGSSRPHATLDLKAKEVTPPTDEKAPASDRPGAAAKTAPEPKRDSRPETAAGTRADPNEGAAKSAAPHEGSARSPGYGGFFTHLAAGVAGGVFALLAADMLATPLGLGRESGAPDAALEARIAAMETAEKEGAGTSVLAARLKAAEDRLGELAQLKARIDQVSAEQTKLADGLEAVDAKSAASDTGELNGRLAKLEEQLATMSAAAENGSDPGRLPQLASLSGKIADLQATLANQLDAVRKSVNDEIETRFMVANEASETAKSGTQRLDREVAAVKSETAEISSGLNALKAEGDRTGAALRAAQDSLSKLKAEVDTRLAAMAKPEDVSAAIAPLSSKLSTLEGNVTDVIKSEESRKSTAERIVLSLELASLKRAIDRGSSFAPELAQVEKLANGTIDLSALERFANTGVPTPAELREAFRPVAFKIIDAGEAPAGGSIVDRLLAGAKSVVRVRKINHSADEKTTDAIVARMETALAEDRMGEVIEEAKSLPPPAQAAAQDFLAKVEARNAVDTALTEVETQLKTSLVAPGAGAAPSKQ